MDQYKKELKNPYTPEVLHQLKAEVKDPLSNTDIDGFFGGYANFTDHVMTLSELSHVTDLDQLFPKDFDPSKKFFAYKIVLLEARKSDGHWITMIKYTLPPSNTVYYEYFCSYGSPPGKILSMNGDVKNQELGQDPDFLWNLMKKKSRDSPESKVIWNTYQFQSKGSDVATCGRWAVLRLLSIDHFNMTLNRFGEFIFNLKDTRYKDLSMDEMVCLLVNIAAG